MRRLGAFLSSFIGSLHFAAACLFIIACLTAPVYHQIGLGKYNDVTYGVFGSCQGTDCTKATAIQQHVGSIQDKYGKDGNWYFNSTTNRNNLGKLLISTPIAAGMNFLTYLIIGTNSFFRYNMFALIITVFFNILTILVSALSCVIVFLLFYPNVTWCAWVLIPAAAFPLISLPMIFFTHTNSPFRKANNPPPIVNNNEDAFDVEKEVSRSRLPSGKTRIEYVNDEDTLDSINEKKEAYTYDITKLDSNYVKGLYDQNNNTSSSTFDSSFRSTSSNYEEKDNKIYSAIDDLENHNNKEKDNENKKHERSATSDRSAWKKAFAMSDADAQTPDEEAMKRFSMISIANDKSKKEAAGVKRTPTTISSMFGKIKNMSIKGNEPATANDAENKSVVSSNYSGSNAPTMPYNGQNTDIDNFPNPYMQQQQMNQAMPMYSNNRPLNGPNGFSNRPMNPNQRQMMPGYGQQRAPMGHYNPIPRNGYPGPQMNRQNMMRGPPRFNARRNGRNNNMPSASAMNNNFAFY